MAVGHNELPATPKEIRAALDDLHQLRGFLDYLSERDKDPLARTQAMTRGLLDMCETYQRKLRDFAAGFDGLISDAVDTDSIHYRAAKALTKGGSPWL